MLRKKGKKARDGYRCRKIKKQENEIERHTMKKLLKKMKKLLTKYFLFDIIYKSSRNSGDFAGMAQSVEHVIGNDEVISSILITSSKKPPKIWEVFLFFVSTPSFFYKIPPQPPL